MSPIAVALLAFGGVVLALAAGILIPPLLETLHGKQFEREAERYAEDERQWWMLHRIDEAAKRLDAKAVHRA